MLLLVRLLKGRFILLSALTKRQQRDLFGVWVKLSPVIICLTTQGWRHPVKYLAQKYNKQIYWLVLLTITLILNVEQASCEYQLFKSWSESIKELNQVYWLWSERSNCYTTHQFCILQVLKLIVLAVCNIWYCPVLPSKTRHKALVCAFKSKTNKAKYTLIKNCS